MLVQDVKQRWWVLMGAAVGLALGAVQLAQRPEDAAELRRPVSAQALVDVLTDPSEPEPPVRNLVVYPIQDRRQYVTGEMPMLSPGGYPITKPFALQARVPFTARVDGREKTWPSLREFLDELSQTRPQSSYRHAWWTSPAVVLGAWIAGGVMIVGVIWPIVLKLLVGAGFGRTASEPELMDLSRFNPASEPASAPAGPSAADLQRLHELEEQLERNLSDSADATPAPPSEPAAAQPVNALSGEALQKLAPKPSEEPKDYKGEFYPVARPGEKKSDSLNGE